MTQPLQIAGKGGRPKRVFTDEQVEKMCNYALGGCQNNTIATILDVPMTTLKRRFGKLLTKKRCERKQMLRQMQTNLAASHPAMAIFLGKNELEQVDKQTVVTETAQRELNEAEKAEAQRLASIRLHEGVA